MKKKILAAVLAMGLGVAGITVTAQAAEQSVVNTCPGEHVWEETGDTGIAWVSANSTYHFKYKLTYYECRNCTATKEERNQIGYELHDFWGIWCHLCGYEDEPGYTR